MPRWALEIFDVPPERRTEGDCRRLHALFRGMRSFDKFTEEIQLNLCRAVTYTCIEETRIVLRRGHIGHNFYFIYSGSVFVNVQDIDSDGEPFIKTEAILAHGDSFGELALLKDIRRTATVSVRETCELLVVEKDVFSQVCPMIFEKELQEKKSFISRMPLFTSKFWNADVLSSLCMEAQIQEYKINKIVVENSTTEEWLYICMEGQCQVIRCLSEEGEEEEEEEGEEEKKKKKDKRKRGRKQSVILSEEIIELLAAASAAAKDGQERPDEETSQEKLLSSLGLEYVNTGKRSGPFLEEVEAEGRRKWLQASSGPMTLTSLMARQEKSGLVFIKVGNLEAEDIFDIGSLLKKPAPRTHSALLLVSCGARLLRLKKSLFHRLASPQALEHAKTVISRHPFPTDTAIVDSYRNKVTWDAYKSQVVHGVVRARDLRTAPKFRADDSKDRAEPQPPQPPGPDRSKSSTNLKSAAEEAKGSTTHKQKGGVTFEEVDKNSAGVGDDGEEEDNTQSSAQDPREPVQQSNRECGLEAIAEDDDDMQTQDDATDPPGSTHRQEQQQRRTFPIMEVDTNPDPGTPRPTSSSSSATAQDLPPMQPPVPLSLLRDAGPAPEAVIIRRKSSIHPNFRPSGVSVDTTFVTRRHRSRDESSSRAPPTTRFKVASDLDPAAVAEKA
ncbi:cyclic nucleotide-binding domain-containing protein 2-like [Babylonia areolata]|uniref:cyclic nucleotide-binding domain-containing protein 2-like n=1 Tax=Babylonia areolata TaxID=304850 RepID=UPI003FCF0862